MPRKKCLWRHYTGGPCITEKDVDRAIGLAKSEANTKLEAEWIGHPNFKKYIIDAGHDNRAYPSTLVEEIRMASLDEDMKDDLARWKKKRRRG